MVKIFQFLKTQFTKLTFSLINVPHKCGVIVIAYTFLLITLIYHTKITFQIVNDIYIGSALGRY